MSTEIAFYMQLQLRFLYNSQKFSCFRHFRLLFNFNVLFKDSFKTCILIKDLPVIDPLLSELGPVLELDVEPEWMVQSKLSSG